jgi:hypothetical protein
VFIALTQHAEIDGNYVLDFVMLDGWKMAGILEGFLGSF